MKYQIGDKVKVREDLEIDESYWMEDLNEMDAVVDEMYELRGTVVTIVEDSHGKYEIAEDDGFWYWTDEMFEELANE